MLLQRIPTGLQQEGHLSPTCCVAHVSEVCTPSPQGSPPSVTVDSGPRPDGGKLTAGRPGGQTVVSRSARRSGVRATSSALASSIQP